MSDTPNTAPLSSVDEDDMDDVRVTLSLDDDSEIECKILTIFELDDQDYIALLPLDDNGEENQEGEVFITNYGPCISAINLEISTSLPLNFLTLWI